MKYKIWNKKDKINGVNAEYVLESHNIKDSDEIFLVIDNYGNVTEIQFVRIIKSNLKLDVSLSAEETAQAYIDLKEKKEEEEIKEQINLEEQNKKIEILESQNSTILFELANIKAGV